MYLVKLVIGDCRRDAARKETVPAKNWADAQAIIHDAEGDRHNYAVFSRVILDERGKNK